MTQYKRIAIDTSKNVFTLHGIDAADHPTLRIDLRRTGLVAFFRKLLPTEIVMEACGAAYHWARELSGLGHDVRLIPPQYVKPFVKRGKNDRNDAAAISEAGGRPGMHFVPVKSLERQAQSMVIKVRQTLIDQRTALANVVRGHAAEFGLVVGKGLGNIGSLLSAIERETAIPAMAKEGFVLLGQEIEELSGRLLRCARNDRSDRRVNLLRPRSKGSGSRKTAPQSEIPCSPQDR